MDSVKVTLALPIIFPICNATFETLPTAISGIGPVLPTGIPKSIANDGSIPVLISTVASPTIFPGSSGTVVTLPTPIFGIGPTSPSGIPNTKLAAAAVPTLSTVARLPGGSVFVLIS